ncbi:hypothetical protein BC829DRAFT_434041 [Chytridium lagenaria]|nr:hypothetical protein BC829DRAFT_434041 [Chytridium lagenaria]
MARWFIVLAAACLSVSASPGGRPREPDPEPATTTSATIRFLPSPSPIAIPTSTLLNPTPLVPSPSPSSAIGSSASNTTTVPFPDLEEPKPPQSLDQLAIICLGISAGIVFVFLALLCAFRMVRAKREREEIAAKPEWFDRRPCLGTLSSTTTSNHSTLNTTSEIEAMDADIPTFMATGNRSARSRSGSITRSLHSTHMVKSGTLEKDMQAGVAAVLPMPSFSTTTSPVSSYSMTTSNHTSPHVIPSDAYITPATSPHLTSTMGVMPISPIYQFPHSEHGQVGVHPDWNLAWMQYYEQQYHQSLMYHHMIRGNLSRDGRYAVEQPPAAHELPISPQHQATVIVEEMQKPQRL